MAAVSIKGLYGVDAPVASACCVVGMHTSTTAWLGILTRLHCQWSQ